MFKVIFRYTYKFIVRHGEYGEAYLNDKPAAVAVMEGLVASGNVDIVVVHESGLEVQRWTESTGYSRKRRYF